MQRIETRHGLRVLPTRQRPPARRPPEVDAAGLAAALRREIAGEVRFDRGSRALYASDASNYRQVPIGVVVPRRLDDLHAALALCRRFGAPILPRGGGTGLAGQSVNVAVIVDCSKYLRRILEIDPVRRLARVEPGVVLDELRRAAERHHLTFGPDPSTHAYCTLGGMIGNNSCGVHSVMAGRTADNVHWLDVLTGDGLQLRAAATPGEELEARCRQPGRHGDIYRRLRALRDRYAERIRARYPRIPRRVSGYNLDELLPERGFHLGRALTGTEGTCALLLEACVRLVDSPPARSLLVLGYPDVYEAGAHVPEILRFGPIGLEGIDEVLVADMKAKHIHPRDVTLLPDGRGWLLAEFGGADKEESDFHAERCMAALKRLERPPSMKLFDDPWQERKLWEVRESGLGATARVPGKRDAWEGWEDSAVPPERVGDYLRDLRGLLERFGYQCALYGHFGQGCIHTRIDFQLKTAAGIRTYRRFLEAAADLVLSYGGSLSGEHGDGQSRAELLPRMFGEDLCQAFREFKAIWDPEGRMNPGKVVDPYRIDENLRFGSDYDPAEVATRFQFPEDERSFAHATERCVGVGKCRRLEAEGESGTMCPSFMVTREERHSTRGRARLLWELLQGDVIGDGWRDPTVREALDLCLACKGCKGECPMNVDMATYKAEFLSHYYQGRRRPRAAYAMGLIDVWARLGSCAPGLANLVAHAPLTSSLFKAAGGIAPERGVPRFAAEPFVRWFRRRPVVNPHGDKVVLWPDTFNNAFHPSVLKAATRVLEAAGCRVLLPRAPLCCGRPLYDFGMLDRATRLLEEAIAWLRPEIEVGMPVVGLEPSCLAVFRDELRGLLPAREEARRLADQALLLSELLERRGYRPPRLDGAGDGLRALYHGHCHQKAVLSVEPDLRLLRGLGFEVEAPATGCCGMAGSFGFEAQHYDVSQAIGERSLLPRVRAADRRTVIVAGGFSCRQQVEGATARRPLHPAELLAAALPGAGRPWRAGPLPERRFDEDERGARRAAARAALWLGAGLLALSALGLRRARRGAARRSRRRRSARR